MIGRIINKSGRKTFDELLKCLKLDRAVRVIVQTDLNLIWSKVVSDSGEGQKVNSKDQKSSCKNESRVKALCWCFSSLDVKVVCMYVIVLKKLEDSFLQDAILFILRAVHGFLGLMVVDLPAIVDSVLEGAIILESSLVR